MKNKMNKTAELFNVGSLICVSISMATVIQILQIVMLILSIFMTISGLIVKFKQKDIKYDDIKDVTKKIEDNIDKLDKMKGDKNEWYINI